MEEERTWRKLYLSDTGQGFGFVEDQKFFSLLLNVLDIYNPVLATKARNGEDVYFAPGELHNMHDIAMQCWQQHLGEQDTVESCMKKYKFNFADPHVYGNLALFRTDENYENNREHYRLARITFRAGNTEAYLYNYSYLANNKRWDIFIRGIAFNKLPDVTIADVEAYAAEHGIEEDIFSVISELCSNGYLIPAGEKYEPTDKSSTIIRH